MEAASVAWEPLGWKAVGFSEIEPFPCAILKHRFPNTPNYGSLTEYQSWPLEPGSIDLLVGGTPCQSFSVAGLRKGLADPRGNLALVFLGLADRLKPKWIVWENVPGVLSSDGGRDFGSFLGALEQLGYGWAYRVLDAQYFGVPQRRRRVFVVASLGGRDVAASVLLKPESLCWHPAKGRATRKEITGTLSSRSSAGGGLGTDFDCAGGVQPVFRKSKRACSTTDNESWVLADASNTLNNFDLGDTRTTHAVVEPFAWTQNQREEVRILGDKTGALALPGTHQSNYIAEPQLYENHPNDSRVTGPLEVDPTIVSRFGTGGGNVPLVNNEPTAITFQPGNLRREAGADPSTTTTTTLKASAGDQMPHVAIQGTIIGRGEHSGPQGTGATEGGPMLTLTKTDIHGVATHMAVRRLTPTECERLQGFPDNWSRIPWKGKPEDQCPDGPRYKACGNSMAVPVMRWIGEQIARVELSHNQPTNTNA
jgi:DNA (cytosine-5)-methyltransferase 1